MLTSILTLRRFVVYLLLRDVAPRVLPELFAAANRTSLEPVALHNDRHSYLWAGAHLHRDGGLEAYRAVFQKARGLPSTDMGLYILR